MLRALLAMMLSVTLYGPILAQDTAEQAPEPQGPAMETPAAPAGVLLRHKFRTGQIDRYKMVAKMKANVTMPGMEAFTGQSGMNMDMSMVTVLRSKVLGILPDGNAKIHYSYESAKMDMGIPGMPKATKAQMTQMQKEMLKNLPKLTVVVSKYGQVLSVEGMEKMPGMPPGMDLNSLMGGAKGMGPWTFGLPAEAVTVGDAWTQDIPFMQAGKLTVDYLLESLNTKVGSQTAAKIKQDFSGHIDLADLMKMFLPAMGASGGQMPQVTGGMDMSGWGVAYFNAARGRLVRSDADIDMVMNMNAVAPQGAAPAGGPQSMNMLMNMNMKVNILNLGG